MHEERIKRYVKRIAEVVDGATIGLDDPKPIPRPRTDGSRSYALVDEVDNKKTRIVSDLLKVEGWSTKFSQEFVEGKISTIVSKNVGTPDNSGIEPMFRELLRDFLEFQKSKTVLIPLEGIVLKVPELRLGKIRLVPATSEYLNGLRKDAERVAQETNDTDDERAEALRSMNEMIDHFRDSVCAERVIVAENARAREIAREELRLTVALLNFMVDALTPDFYKARVGLRGEFSRGLRIELAKDGDSFGWQTLPTGPRAPLIIDDKVLAAIKTLKIPELADQVTSEKFDADATFEGTILTAIHFHSHSTELPDPTDKVLNLITAIESFFETGGKQIANTVANGCALVLCNKLDDRLKMKRLIKKLYGLRSSVSHFGKGTVLESDIKELSFISWQFICFAIESRSKYKDKAAFNEWVEKLEMGLENELSIVTFRDSQSED